MTVFESFQRNTAFEWKLISCNTVSLILAVITAACNSTLGRVTNFSFNGASVDFANISMVVTLMTDLK